MTHTLRQRRADAVAVSSHRGCGNLQSLPLRSQRPSTPGAASSTSRPPRQTPDDMDPDKDNANPTILNPSDLPSRRRESSVKKREGAGVGLFDDLIPAYSYLNDPFDAPQSSDDSDDGSVEDIDEQEIYGEQRAAKLSALRPAC